jgi:hypothetical protein
MPQTIFSEDFNLAFYLRDDILMSAPYSPTSFQVEFDQETTVESWVEESQQDAIEDIRNSLSQ